MNRIGLPVFRLVGQAARSIQTGCPPNLVTGSRMGVATSWNVTEYLWTIDVSSTS
jgi:hypothetical protein